MITILYFGRLAETAGTNRSEIAPPAEIVDTDTLCMWLSRDNAGLAVALARGAVRLAVNRELVAGNRSIAPGDEVAFLPPVSGG